MSDASHPGPLRICLVGATGLVGESVIARAVGRRDVRIIGVARREAVLPKGARMEMLLADPAGWGDAIGAANARVMVCALGTTWKKAGRDEDAYRAVDQDLVLSCAHAAKAAGIDHFILVSAVGADPAAKALYLRMKGEVEGAISRLRFRRFDILRPGILRGRRHEWRPFEWLGQRLARVADLFLRGDARKYHSVSADFLADVVFALSQEKAAGHFVHDYDAMLRALRRARG